MSKIITVNTQDLKEQIALSLASFLDGNRFAISTLSLKIANEIEQMSINTARNRLQANNP